VSQTGELRRGLWYSVWKLLLLSARITYNNLRRASLRRKIGSLVLALFILAAMAGIFAASLGILSLVRSPQAARFFQPELLLANLPIWVLTAAFLGLILTSFGVLLQSLYLTGDMEFLLSKPVSIRAVFVAKLIQAILPDFGFVCLFTLPVLFGLGISGHFSVIYYPLVLLVLMALALSVAALSSLLVMAVVRVVPARRVAELLGFIGALASFICAQSGQVANSLSFSRGQLSGAVSSLSGLSAPWSPLTWAGQGLMQVAQGQWAGGFARIALFLALTLGVFYFALVTAERLYYTGWSRVQVGTHRKHPRRAAGRLAPGRTPGVYFLRAVTARIPAPVRGLVAKDFRVLPRDLRNMSQVITPLLFGIIYAFTLARTGGRMGSSPPPGDFLYVINRVSVYANVGISLFVSWALLSRLALMSFSQEGRHYWILKAAPVSPVQLLAAKFLVAYLPPIVVGSAFLVIISIVQRADLGTVAYGLVMIAFSIAGAVGVNLAFGVAGTDLKWQNPRRMLRTTFGCLSSLVGTVYMFLVAAVFFGPPIVFEIFGLPEVLGKLTGLVVGIAISLACAVLPPGFVLDRVARIGEEGD